MEKKLQKNIASWVLIPEMLFSLHIQGSDRESNPVLKFIRHTLEYQECKIALPLYKHKGQDCKSTCQWPKSALLGVNGIFTTGSRTKPVIPPFGNPILGDMNETNPL